MMKRTTFCLFLMTFAAETNAFMDTRELGSREEAYDLVSNQLYDLRRFEREKREPRIVGNFEKAWGSCSRAWEFIDWAGFYSREVAERHLGIAIDLLWQANDLDDGEKQDREDVMILEFEREWVSYQDVVYSENPFDESGSYRDASGEDMSVGVSRVWKPDQEDEYGGPLDRGLSSIGRAGNGWHTVNWHVFYSKDAAVVHLETEIELLWERTDLTDVQKGFQTQALEQGFYEVYGSPYSSTSSSESSSDGYGGGTYASFDRGAEVVNFGFSDGSEGEDLGNEDLFAEWDFEF